MKSALPLLFTMFLVAGCSKSDVSGDIFIIKGDGSIAPSAGRTVRFIPVESEAIFFDQIKTATISEAQLELAPVIAEQCSAMLDVRKRKLNSFNTELRKIQQKVTVPSDGCDALISESSMLELESKPLRNQYDDKIEKLNKELKLTKKELETRITQVTKELHEAEYANVYPSIIRTKQTIFPYNIFPYNILLENNSSDFCVTNVGSLRLYAGDIMIKEYGGDLSPLEDQFGYKKGKCGIEANGFKKITVYYREITTDTPQLRKAIYEKKVKSFPCGADNCVVITSIKIGTTVEFARLERLESESDVSYMSVDVDWKEEAKSSAQVRKEQKAVENAQARLDAAEKEYESNQLVAAFIKASKATNECQSDEDKMSVLEESISSISRKLSRVSDCSISAPRIESTLIELNSDLELRIELPKGKKEFEVAFYTGAIEAMYDSGYKVDTSIQGHYSITDIPKGKYLIFAEYRDNFVDGFWLEPVNIQERKQKIDLNMSNFVNVSFSNYLHQYSSACENCLSPNFDFPSRREAIAAIKLDELRSK